MYDALLQITCFLFFTIDIMLLGTNINLDRRKNFTWCFWFKHQLYYKISTNWMNAIRITRVDQGFTKMLLEKRKDDISFKTCYNLVLLIICPICVTKGLEKHYSRNEDLHKQACRIFNFRNFDFWCSKQAFRNFIIIERLKVSRACREK